MPKHTTNVLYEKATGSELFTSREAARFLDYHPVAFRNLVSKGKIRIHSRTGNYPLFLREELEKYQATNKWAGKKAKHKAAATPPISTIAGKGALAVVTAVHNRKEVVIEELTDFKWEAMPAILARVSARHGKLSFKIKLEFSDGTGLTVIFRPSPPKAKH